MRDLLHRQLREIVVRKVQFLETVHLVARWFLVAKAILPDISIFPLLVSLDYLRDHLPTLIIQLICRKVDLFQVNVLAQTWYEYFK